MTPKNRERLGQLVVMLAEAFRQTASKHTLAAYELGLMDLPLEDCERIVVRAIRECKFMPSVSELREMLGAGSMSHKDAAVLAWDCFERAVVRHGGYSTVLFEDPAINATVRQLGGWERCCGMPAEEFDTWLRKDFERIYAVHARTGRGSDDPLLGMFARDNLQLVGSVHGVNTGQAHLIECDWVPDARRVALPAPRTPTLAIADESGMEDDNAT